jgi:hypothetical protein
MSDQILFECVDKDDGETAGKSITFRPVGATDNDGDDAPELVYAGVSDALFIGFQTGKQYPLSTVPAAPPATPADAASGGAPATS